VASFDPMLALPHYAWHAHCRQPFYYWSTNRLPGRSKAGYQSSAIVAHTAAGWLLTGAWSLRRPAPSLPEIEFQLHRNSVSVSRSRRSRPCYTACIETPAIASDRRRFWNVGEIRPTIALLLFIGPVVCLPSK